MNAQVSVSITNILDFMYPRINQHTLKGEENKRNKKEETREGKEEKTTKELDGRRK
jgi:hypothetical protein